MIRPAGGKDMNRRSWWHADNPAFDIVNVVGALVASWIPRAVVDGIWTGDRPLLVDTALSLISLIVALVVLHACPAIRPSRWFRPIDAIALFVVGVFATTLLEAFVATLVSYA